MQLEAIVRLCVLATAFMVIACSNQTNTGDTNQTNTGGSGPSPKPKSLSIGELIHDCAACPEIFVVPAGSFEMGSDESDPDAERNEKPRHLVTISAPFGVSRYEITVEQFRSFVEASGYKASSVCYADPDGDGQYEDLAAAGYGWSRPGFPQYEQSNREPVTCVTWHDAQAYAAWLTRRTGKKYRLLTEAEWEYAARAGSTTRFYWGDDSATACGYGNVADIHAGGLTWWLAKWPVAQCDDGWLYTAPVGLYHANEFFLRDMTGNVSEWVQDCYVETYRDAPRDGTAVDGTCDYRVVRGGNWGNSPNRQRSAARDWEKPEETGHSFGFRVARQL